MIKKYVLCVTILLSCFNIFAQQNNISLDIESFNSTKVNALRFDRLNKFLQQYPELQFDLYIIDTEPKSKSEHFNSLNIDFIRVFSACIYPDINVPVLRCLSEEEGYVNILNVSIKTLSDALGLEDTFEFYVYPSQNIKTIMKIGSLPQKPFNPELMIPFDDLRPKKIQRWLRKNPVYTQFLGRYIELNSNCSDIEIKGTEESTYRKNLNECFAFLNIDLNHNLFFKNQISKHIIPENRPNVNYEEYQREQNDRYKKSRMNY